MTRYRFRGHRRAQDAIDRLKKKSRAYLEKAAQDREDDMKNKKKEEVKEEYDDEKTVERMQKGAWHRYSKDYLRAHIKRNPHIFHPEKVRAELEKKTTKEEANTQTSPGIEEEDNPKVNLPEKYSGEFTVRKLYMEMDDWTARLGREHPHNSPSTVALEKMNKQYRDEKKKESAENRKKKANERKKEPYLPFGKNQLPHKKQKKYKD